MALQACGTQASSQPPTQPGAKRAKGSHTQKSSMATPLNWRQCYINPIWPVKKPDRSYRFTIDYMHLNKCSPQVREHSDLGAIINGITTGSGTDYLVTDLSDMFFTILIDEESQPTTAFTGEGRQY